MNVEKILDFLADAWSFCREFAFEIVVSVLILGFAGFFALLIVLAYNETQEQDARLEYCYQEGYAEVIESQHTPRYYCFDARLDPSAFRAIPEEVWTGTDK